MKKTIVFLVASLFAASFLAKNLPSDSLDFKKNAPVVITSDCTPKTFCLLQNSCTQGSATLSCSADGGCSSLTYTWQVDLNNNGNFDLSGTGSTLTQNFPSGTHRIAWRAKDDCGQFATCQYTFSSKDCSPPTGIIASGLNLPLQQPDCVALVKAEDYIQNLTDNCTPSAQIELGIRLTGSGSGFPTDKTLSLGTCQAGTSLVEIWARDAAGNATFFNAYVIVQNNQAGCVCKKDTIRFSGKITDALGQPVFPTNLVLQVGGGSVASPPVNTPFQFDTLTGDYFFDVISRPSVNPVTVSFIPKKYGNPLNGLSTLDLVAISKHILEVKKFDTFYKAVAADVTANGNVSTFDIVEMRKVLLGLNANFPSADSWRFIRPVADPTDLFQYSNISEQFVTTFYVSENQSLPDFPNLDFIAVKTGDANFSANPKQ